MAKDVKTIEGEDNRLGQKMEKPIFIWESPDRIVYRKSVSWYMGVIFVALSLAAILYYQHLWSGIALIFVAALTFILLSQSKPRIVKSAVYAQGIVIDDRVYRYGDLKSFWITLTDIPKARLQMNGIAAGILTMPLGENDPEQIRLYLSRYLPEDNDKGEDIADTVNRFLRF